MITSTSRASSHSPRERLAELTEIGHCGPDVAQRLLETSGTDANWIVGLCAGLSRGIGATGSECAAVTAPLVVLGLRHRGATMAGLPLVIRDGHRYCRRFLECDHALRCTEAGGEDRFPARCAEAVRSAPEQLAEIVSGAGADSMSPEAEEAYRRLHAHLSARRFHCAGAVLQQVRGLAPVDADLLDATSAFVGGTLFKGMTCSALTAGVMAIGLKATRLGDTRHALARTLRTLVAGGDSTAHRANELDRIVELGRRLSRWFLREFGTTQCRELTGRDFATVAGVERFVESGWVARCETIARRVAEQASRAS